MNGARAWLGLAILSAALLAPCSAPLAAVFDVEHSGDDGDFSLRWAIEQVNASSDTNNTINFAFTDPFDTTIILLSDLDRIERDVTLDGGDYVLVGVITSDISILLNMDIAPGVNVDFINIGTGNINMDVGAGGSLSVGRNDAIPLDMIDSVSGEGRFRKFGDDTITILDTQTYTGGTVIADGAIVFRENTAPKVGDFEVQSTGELIFDLRGGSPEQVDSVIRGGGNVVKRGPDALVLAGSNTFSGELRIEEGQVHVEGRNSLSADTFIGVDLGGTAAELVFTSTCAGGASTCSDFVYPGDTSGAGLLRKSGNATLELTGVLGHTGGTFIDAGVLSGDADALQGVLTLSGGGLRIAQATDDVFAGDIRGAPGSVVTKTGAGTLTFDSAQNQAGSAFGLDVQAGAVHLAGAGLLPGRVRVESGGTLSGSGQVDGSQPSVILGRLDPDRVATGADALVFANALQFGAGGTYVVALADVEGTSSRARAAAGIQIDPAAILEVSVDAGDYDTAKRYRLLDSGGAITGDFGTVRTDQAFVGIVVDRPGAGQYDVLVQTNIDSSPLARNPNQQSAALAVDEYLTIGNAPPDMQTVRDAYSVLLSSEVPAALDAMTGNALGGFTTSRITNSERFASAISSRFTAGRHALQESHAGPGIASAGLDATRGFGGGSGARSDGPFALLETQRMSTSRGAPGPFTFTPARDAPGVGGWIDGFAIFSSLDGDKGASDVSSRLYGTSAGLDYRHPIGREALRFGAAFGYTRMTLDADQAPTTGDANTYQGALYAAYTWERLYVGAMGRFGYTDISTQREIAFGVLNRTAEAGTDGLEASGYIEIGGLIGDPEELAITPLAAFQYGWFDQAGFSESGAQTLDLVVAGGDTHSMVTTLGVQFARVYRFDPLIFGGSSSRNQFGIEPSFRLGWMHEFGDRGRHVDGRISGAFTGGSFTVAGAETQRDSFYAGIGYVMRINDGLLVAFDYDVRFDPSRVDNAIRGALYLNW